MATGVGGGAAAGGAPVGPSAPETNAPQRRAPASGDQQGSFAGLLAGSGAPDDVIWGKGVEPPSEPTSGDGKAGTGEEQAEDLPDQILNLLGGNAWPPGPMATGGEASQACGATGPLSIPLVAGATHAGNATAAGLLAAGAATPGPAGPAGPAGAAGSAAGAPAALGAGMPPMSAIGMTEGADSPRGLPATAGVALQPAAAVASPESEAVDALEFALPGQTPGINGPGRNGAPPLPGAPMAMPAEPDAGFDDSFGARIGWMAEQRLGHAQLRVSPDHLGPIDVRLQLDGTRVTAEFACASAEVRHALEASVGRLRDLLDQQGLQLAQADVGGGRRGDSDKPDGAQPEPASDSFDGPRIGGIATAPLQLRRGLLDEYA